MPVKISLVTLSFFLHNFKLGTVKLSSRQKHVIFDWICKNETNRNAMSCWFVVYKLQSDSFFLGKQSVEESSELE